MIKNISYKIYVFIEMSKCIDKLIMKIYDFVLENKKCVKIWKTSNIEIYRYISGYSQKKETKLKDHVGSKEEIIGEEE